MTDAEKIADLEKRLTTQDQNFARAKKSMRAEIRYQRTMKEYYRNRYNNATVTTGQVVGAIFLGALIGGIAYKAYKN